jgi:hypothetical protein
MKIHQILGAPSIILTNEEKEFISKHHPKISIHSLYDREEVVARNLVRKGVYEISNDNEHIILQTDAKNKTTII